MLPKGERLLRPAQFREVYRRGRAYATPLAVLHVGSGDGATLAGFVASKKVGKAVVRNQAKRRLREAYRLIRHRVSPGKQLVWVLRPAAGQASYAGLAAVVGKLLQDAGLLTEAEGDLLPHADRSAVGVGV